MSNPTLSRGSNLLVVAPPSPAYAEAALAGLVEHAGDGNLVIVLAPPASLAEWSAVLPAGTRAVVAGGLRQATRALKGRESPGVLIVSPATGVALREKSALDPARVGAVLAAWPE